MTPLMARDDRPQATRLCHVFYRETAAESDCVYGDPAGDRVVVLWGDSHAEALFPAFNRAAKENHWRLHLWSKAACPPMDHPVWLPRFHRPYGECDQWRESVLQRLERLGKVDAIILARSHHYIDRLMQGSTVLTDAAQVRRSWTEASSRTFERLRKISN